MAEWLGRALQKLVQRFESARDLKKAFDLKRLKAFFIYYSYIYYEPILGRCGHGWVFILFSMKLNSTQYISAVIIALIPVVFKRPFEKVVDHIIVEPVFSDFEPTYLIDLLFLAGTISMLGLLISYRSRGRQLDWPGIILLSIVSLYLLTFKYKLLGFDHWCFITLKLTDRIAYLDAAIYFPVALLLYKVFSIHPRIFVSDDATFQLLDDSHIKDKTEDELNRQQLADYVASFIHHSKSDVSTAIAINAQWGDGKTSFQKMVSEAIAAKDGYAIRIEFNPWRSSGANKIVQDFFELYASNIGEFNIGLGDRVLSYGRKLLAGSSWWSSLPFFGSTDDNSESQYEEINEAIKSVERKVIVFIDDLDRLSFTEILEVVKLVRNSANFANTFFIVGYDEEYMHEALSAHNEYGKENFLEKIFQVQFDLSQVDPNVVKTKLAEYLKKSLPQSHW